MAQPRRLVLLVANLIIFWLALPAALYGLGLAADHLLGLPAVGPCTRWAGLAPLAFGAWLCLHSILLLRVKGKGLPISALPPTELVAVGPYRWFRHPIYTGFTLLAAGGGLLAGSLGTAFVAVPLVAAVWFLTWVKIYEEPDLHRRYGPSFRVYRDRTALFFPLGLRRLARAFVKLVFRLMFRLEVQGREHEPASGPVLFVSDHLSYLDFMFAQYVSRRPITIPTTAEVFRTPLKRAFMKLMGGVPTRRFAPDPASALALADALRAGGVVGIAVEGERSWTGEMAAPADNVALNIRRFDCPIVPVAFGGAYRLWPRWAGGADRHAPVTIRLGAPFTLDQEVTGISPGSAGEGAAIAEYVRSRIAELRAPGETSTAIGIHPDSRPELALWRCPICSEEDTLELTPERRLLCAVCGASWEAGERDLTLLAPDERAGQTETIAGWAALAGNEVDLEQAPDPILSCDQAEYREDPDGRLTLEPLRSLGTGVAVIRDGRLAWMGDGLERTILLGEIRSVTTERNDTIQLGTRRGVAQLVLTGSSPLRWQTWLLALTEAQDV